MNVKNIIKHSKFGIIFAIIGLIFAGISSAFATTYESTDATFTTSYNSNVTNVYGAVNDLYSKYSAVPRLSAADRYGMVSYKYWNYTGSTASRSWPTQSYETVAELASSSDLSDYPVYIRTVRIGVYVSTHEVCVRYNNIDACLPNDLWAGELGDNSSTTASSFTKFRIKRFLESTLGIQSSTCSSGSAIVSLCYTDDRSIEIQSFYTGKVTIKYKNSSLNSTRSCQTYLSGTEPRASCSTS